MSVEALPVQQDTPEVVFEMKEKQLKELAIQKSPLLDTVVGMVNISKTSLGNNINGTMTLIKPGEGIQVKLGVYISRIEERDYDNKLVWKMVRPSELRNPSSSRRIMNEDDVSNKNNATDLQAHSTFTSMLKNNISLPNLIQHIQTIEAKGTLQTILGEIVSSANIVQANKEELTKALIARISAL